MMRSNCGPAVYVRRELYTYFFLSNILALSTALAMAVITKFSSLALAFLGMSSAQDQIPISASLPSSIPLIGFGTWNLRLSSHNTSAAVSTALEAGYRHLDCAAIYGNEKHVGRGIKNGLEAAELKREVVWITSKLWNDQ